MEGLWERLKDCPKNEQSVDNSKRRFEGNYEILKTIFQPNKKGIIIQYTSKPEGFLFIV